MRCSPTRKDCSKPSYNRSLARILAPVGRSFQLRPSDDISGDLNKLGVALLGNMLDQSTLTIFRQFVSIGVDRPEIGKQAFLSGPGVLYQKLEEYFAACVDDGRLAIDDVPSTARIFVEMLKGDYQLRALMTGESDCDPEEIERHVQRAVTLFLNGARGR